jgi:RNA methyltransferase, TrmH family
MVSASRIKHVASLRVPKFREMHGHTVAEGSRVIREMLLTGYPYDEIFATERWADRHPDLWRAATGGVTLCSEKELERMSALKSPQGVLAVIPIPEESAPDAECHLSLFCDRISDPGNMGTILRIADWFGAGQVVVAPGSANFHNPRVIQATMGSLFRVPVTTATLCHLKEILPDTARICGAVTHGTPLPQIPTDNRPIVIVVGNEAEGITPENLALCTEQITIPGKAAPLPGETAESLNAAIAAAILCYHFAQPE